MFHPEKDYKPITIEGGDIDEQFEKCFGDNEDCPNKTSCCNFGKVDDKGEYQEFKCLNDSMHEDAMWGYFRNIESYPY